MNHRSYPVTCLTNKQTMISFSLKVRFNLAGRMAMASIFKRLSSVCHPRRNYSTFLKPEENNKGLLAWLSPNDMPQLPKDQAIGKVVIAHGHFARVIVKSGSAGVELLCAVRTVLKKINMQVLVGDQVLVRGIDWRDRKGVVQEVFQRKNKIKLPPVANVSHLLVVFSFEQPKIQPTMVTTFVEDAKSDGVPVTLAINKAELVDEVSLKEWKLRLDSWGYEAVFCSVKTGRGLDALKLILKDKTSVIIGPSGVGKSSLINAIRGSIEHTKDDNWFENIRGSKWLEEQRVGEVSERNRRGNHTTTNVSLVPLPEGGFLADTPGLSQPRKIKFRPPKLNKGEVECVVKYAEPISELKSVGISVKHDEARLAAKKFQKQSRKSVKQSLLDD